jgi:hypothetical protein
MRHGDGKKYDEIFSTLIYCTDSYLVNFLASVEALESIEATAQGRLHKAESRDWGKSCRYNVLCSQGWVLRELCMCNAK